MSDAEIKSKIKLINQKAGNIFTALSNSDNIAQVAFLKKLIPEADNVIMSAKPRFDKLAKTEMPINLNFLIQQKIKNYLDHRQISLFNKYARTFQHYHIKLDDFTTRIVQADVTFRKCLENSHDELNSVIHTKNSEFESTLKEAERNNAIKLEKYKQQVEININSLQDRLVEETQRVTTHYEKQLDSKTEALTMTQSALIKAKEDINAIEEATKKEIDEVKEKNNRILNEHKESVMSMLVDDETKASQLQSEVDILEAKANALNPELDDQWRRKQEELNSKFQKQDEEFENSSQENEKYIQMIKDQIQESDQTLDKLKQQNEYDFNRKRSELENLYQQLIDGRAEKVDQASKELTEKLAAKVQRLKDNLAKLEQQIENDRKALHEKIEDKSLSHADKVTALEDSHKAQVQSIVDDTNHLKEEIEKLKEEWAQEKIKIENEYNQDLKDVESRQNTEVKYFQAKVTALRKELHQVLAENAALTVDGDEVNKEITNLDLTYRSTEEELSARLAAEIQNKVDERVQKKMAALKAKHNKEREQLLGEKAQFEESENQLNIQYAGVQGKISKTSSSGSLSTFASARFVDAQIDKWREDFFVDCVALKQEEAEALKNLDNSKLEFQNAVHRTIQLREKLEQTTQFYQEAVQNAQGKNEEELKSMRSLLEEKEKEISELEKQFEENERELHRRTRQIEQAEDKLANLRSKLANEKVKVKEIIKKEYQPLIRQEQRKSEVMVSELEKLRNELELAIEYTQHDLFVVETSNAAMEEGLRKETESLVEQMKGQLIQELQEIEEKVSNQISEEENQKLEEINNETASFEEEEQRVQDEYQKLIEELKSKHKDQITKLNDYCIDIISMNSEKKKRVFELANVKCDVCPRLDKNIKKIETVLINMQEEDRNLQLDDKNMKEAIHTFASKKSPLPPIPASIL